MYKKHSAKSNKFPLSLRILCAHAVLPFGTFPVALPATKLSPPYHQLFFISPVSRHYQPSQKVVLRLQLPNALLETSDFVLERIDCIQDACWTLRHAKSLVWWVHSIESGYDGLPSVPSSEWGSRKSWLPSACCPSTAGSDLGFHVPAFHGWGVQPAHQQLKQ